MAYYHCLDCHIEPYIESSSVWHCPRCGSQSIMDYNRWEMEGEEEV